MYTPKSHMSPVGASREREICRSDPPVTRCAPAEYVGHLGSRWCRWPPVFWRTRRKWVFPVSGRLFVACRVSKERITALPLEQHAAHGTWYYTLCPRQASISQATPARLAVASPTPPLYSTQVRARTRITAHRGGRTIERPTNLDIPCP